jgi:Rrf2 family protein
MFVISSKARYGLQAMIVLTRLHGQGLARTKDVAAAADIPQQFLEQIFNQLVKAGIILSVRGKKGGYQLAQTPEQIDVLRILEVLEGDIELAKTENSGNDAVEELLLRVESDLRQSFRITLAELTRRHEQLRCANMFYI